MDSVYYKPSGKLSASVFIFYAIFAVVSIPILACVYTNIVYYMPYVYLNILAAAGLALLLGYILGKAMTLGKCRNPLLAGGLSIISVALLKYVSWSFYIPIVYSEAYEVIELSFMEKLESALYFFIDPAAVFEYMYEISQIGVWSISSLTFNGVLLYIVWGVEICGIAVICTMMTSAAAKKPYCEETDKWFVESKKEIELNMPEDLGQFKANLESSQTGALIDMLNEEFTNADNYLSVKFYSLDDVGYGYMTVENVSKTVDKKGKEKVSKKEIVEFVRVGRDVTQAAERRHDLAKV